MFIISSVFLLVTAKGYVFDCLSLTLPKYLDYKFWCQPIQDDHPSYDGKHKNGYN